MAAEQSILNYWPQWFRDLVPGGLPLRTYCAVDIETSGYQADRSLVMQWGHIFVEDGNIKDHLSVTFDWTRSPKVDQAFLRRSLDYLVYKFASVGTTYPISYEVMQKDGIDPANGFEFIANFVRDLGAGGVPFVLHGGTFDENFLSVAYGLYAGKKGFSFGPQGFYDTEAVEKASQLISHERMHPKKGDTLRSYFKRVRASRFAGIKSNMDEHCYEKYGFAKRGIKKTELHDAAMDAYCCHVVLQEQLRHLSAPLTPPFLPTAAAVLVDVRRTPVAAPSPRTAQAPLTRIRGQRKS